MLTGRYRILLPTDINKPNSIPVKLDSQKALFLHRGFLSEHLRNERRLLFFSFLLLFIPALEGDSSLAFGWLETFEEFC